ncbi:hypothetical protein JW905_05070 [bacterium]|nr:hypothetical protein [candidate division CSSED10-310 bacterium]
MELQWIPPLQTAGSACRSVIDSARIRRLDYYDFNDQMVAAFPVLEPWDENTLTLSTSREQTVQILTTVFNNTPWFEFDVTSSIALVGEQRLDDFIGAVP